MSDPLVEAVAAFERAVEDVQYVRGVWEAGGRPLEQFSTNGLAGVHPVRRALVEAEDRVARRAELVKRMSGSGQRGRPVGAVSAADRVPQVRMRRLEPVS